MTVAGAVGSICHRPQTRRTMKLLYRTLVLFVVAAAFTVAPSVIVSRVVYRIFRSRNHPLAWYPAFVVMLVWCGLAIWSAKAFLSFRIESQPAVGLDPFSAIVLVALAAVIIAAWLVLLSPSFAALVTLLVLHPGLKGSAGRFREAAERFWAHPRRNYMLAAVAIALAAALRAVLWFKGF